MEFYNGIFSSDWQFAALAFCALLIGFSKTGIQGAVVVSIPMMALAFGAKESTGVILPMLCFADLIAVAYYRRDADWRLVLKLLPSAVVGFFCGSCCRLVCFGARVRNTDGFLHFYWPGYDVRGAR